MIYLFNRIRYRFLIINFETLYKNALIFCYTTIFTIKEMRALRMSLKSKKFFLHFFFCHRYTAYCLSRERATCVRSTGGATQYARVTTSVVWRNLVFLSRLARVVMCCFYVYFVCPARFPNARNRIACREKFIKHLYNNNNRPSIVRFPPWCLSWNISFRKSLEKRPQRAKKNHSKFVPSI